MHEKRSVRLLLHDSNDSWHLARASRTTQRSAHPEVDEMLMILRFLFLSFGSLERMYGATSLINRNGAVLCTLSINSNMSSGVVCSICEWVQR